jgi:hypothetical protein
MIHPSACDVLEVLASGKIVLIARSPATNIATCKVLRSAFGIFHICTI